MQALIDELKKPEYQGLTDQQAADMVNAKMVTVRKPVELWQVEEHASRKGYRAKLEKASRDDANQCQEIAINILTYIKSNRLSTVDMDLPETRQMLGAMVQCGFALQSHINELIALGDSEIRWVDQQGFGTVGDGQVSAELIKDLRDEASGLKARRHQLMQAGAIRWNLYVSAVDALTLNDSDPVL